MLRKPKPNGKKVHRVPPAWRVDTAIIARNIVTSGPRLTIDLADPHTAAACATIHQTLSERRPFDLRRILAHVVHAVSRLARERAEDGWHLVCMQPPAIEATNRTAADLLSKHSLLIPLLPTTPEIWPRGDPFITRPDWPPDYVEAALAGRLLRQGLTTIDLFLRDQEPLDSLCERVKLKPTLAVTRSLWLVAELFRMRKTPKRTRLWHWRPLDPAPQIARRDYFAIALRETLDLSTPRLYFREPRLDVDLPSLAVSDGAVRRELE